MPRKHSDDAAYLWDMHDACQRVLRFMGNRSLQEFLFDEVVQSAVERQIEIIGEAARHISADFQSQHPELPWRPIIAQRHILSHEYGDIDASLIYRVVTVHIPSLLAILSPLLKDRLGS